MSHEEQLHPVDVAVLRHLATGVDYPTCIAVRRGVDRADVERRCERLTDRDFVEPVTHEVVYRITAAGRRALAARTADRSDRTSRSAASELSVASGERSVATSEQSVVEERERPGVEEQERTAVEERERSEVGRAESQ